MAFEYGEDTNVMKGMNAGIGLSMYAYVENGAVKKFYTYSLYNSTSGLFLIGNIIPGAINMNADNFTVTTEFENATTAYEAAC